LIGFLIGFLISLDRGNFAKKAAVLMTSIMPFSYWPCNDARMIASCRDVALGDVQASIAKNILVTTARYCVV